MDTIIALTKIDFPSVFVSVFLILTGIKAMVSIFEWVTTKLGFETKWMKKRHEEQEQIFINTKMIRELSEKQQKDTMESIQQDKIINDKLKQLTNMFIDKEIDDMRWEINNFATKVSEGKPCNKDSYKHCIQIYEKYEKLLKQNGLENGEVEISMEIIHDSYKQKLKEGF
ncbi:MAG: hypothetical protein HDT30_12155 [Clostridiales bacterium]|nr:hypothetical protein [Clostridiales bacterium]